MTGGREQEDLTAQDAEAYASITGSTQHTAPDHDGIAPTDGSPPMDENDAREATVDDPDETIKQFVARTL